MIYINSLLYPLVAAQIYTDDGYQMLLVKLRSKGFNQHQISQAETWKNKLIKDGMFIEKHPDGETIYTQCMVTGLPAHCEICNEFKRLPDLYAKYKGKLLVYRGNDYESVFDAEESGGVYASTMDYTDPELNEGVITAGMMDALNILNYAIGAEGMVWGHMKPNNQFFQINDPVTLEKKL